MAAPFRTKAQREQRLARVADLLARGYSHTQIAVVLGGSRQQADYDVRVVRKRWRKEQVANVGLVVAKAEAQLNWIIREATDAWEASKGERKSTRTRQRKTPPSLQVVDAEFEPTRERIEHEAVVRIEQRDPDPRYLEVARKAVMDIVELHGARGRPVDDEEPIRRVVVYMERGADDPGPSGLPPGPPSDLGGSTVIDVPAAVQDEP